MCHVVSGSVECVECGIGNEQGLFAVNGELICAECLLLRVARLGPVDQIVLKSCIKVELPE